MTESLKCRWREHRDIKLLTSDCHVYEKGNREVAVFSGTLERCVCGYEQFHGKPIPWFEGTREQWEAKRQELGLDGKESK